MLPVFVEIPKERKDAIKTRIDAFGRKEFAAAVGEGYMTMSNRLNGFGRFQACVADHYERELRKRGA
jgi:hypothetical protein